MENRENRKQQILLVDDDPDILLLLSIQLKQAGYAVVTATDGTSALALFKSQPFDLILTDAMMPDMSGQDLVAGVRAIEQDGHLPVIMLSAIQAQVMKPIAASAGVDLYISKPYNRVELLAAIAGLLK